MPTIATGRIAFWEGGSLWVFDVPETPDHPERTGMHAHHAFQLSLALRGAIRLHFQDHALAGAAVLVAPDVAHALEAHGLVANLFIEPESRFCKTVSTLQLCISFFTGHEYIHQTLYLRHRRT